MRKPRRLAPEELAAYEWQPPRRFGRWGVGVVEQSPGTAVPGLSDALDWAALFGNANPVEVEVGMGKGLFLLTQALARPGVNFFGIEVVRKVQRYAATHPLEPGAPVEALRQALGLPERSLVEALVTPPLVARGGRVTEGEPGGGLPGPLQRAVDTVAAELARAPFVAPEAYHLADLGLGPREVAAAVRAGVVLAQRPQRGLVVADDGALLLPRGEELGGVLVDVAARGLGQVDLDDVVRRAREERLALLRVDDVVGRRDDGGEAARARQVVVESPEGSDVGHGGGDPRRSRRRRDPTYLPCPSEGA